MNKQVFIIHGWEGHPGEAWFLWLKKELEMRDFEVHIPPMPESHVPRIFKWIPAISHVVKNPDENTYFVGHSLGNQGILRYLESLSEGTKIGGAVFVAGFIRGLSGLKPSEQETADHWLNSSLDLKKIRKHLPKSIAIFSDNDPYIPLDNRQEFENILGSKIVIDHNKGHFTGMGEDEDSVLELPSALDAVLELAGLK